MRRTGSIGAAAVMAVLAVAASAPGAAGAQRYTTVTLNTVTPVSGLAASSAADTRLRLIVRSDWRVRRSGAALRIDTGGRCRYRLTVRHRMVAGAAATAAAHVAGAVPGSARALKDEGTRGVTAWRVLRTSGGLQAMLARSYARWPGLAPGDVVWHEVTVDGREGAECHRGPADVAAAALGDALATARTSARARG